MTSRADLLPELRSLSARSRHGSACFDFDFILLSSLCLCVSVVIHPSAAEEPAKIDTRRGDAMFAAYFAAETAKLEGAVLDDIKTKEDWLARKDELRRQLHEMLGLDPLPERTPLNAVVTGTLDHPEFTVEKLHFQSRPQLYVTGNLYVPEGTDEAGSGDALRLRTRQRARRTASATAARRTTSITGRGSPGTATSA